MVSLFVLCEQTHIIILEECFFNQFEFFVLGDSVDDVLECVSTPIVTRNFYEFVTFYLFEKVDALVHLQVFYQLRAKIVPVVVRHQVWQLPVDLVNDLIDK